MGIGLKEIIKPIGSQSFLVGIGIAALAYFLGPQLKESLRPAAVKGAQGVISFGNKTKEMFDEGMGKLSGSITAKADDIADNTKEAFSNMGLNSDLLRVFKEDREMSNKILEELKNSVISLKEEISQMKSSGNFQQE